MINAHTAWALGAAAALTAVSLGCSTPRTHVTEQWKDPTFAAGPMHRVVVVAQNMPGKVGRELEDQFVDELEDEGVSAVQGHKVFGNDVPDADTMRPILTRNGFDAALFLSVAEVDARTKSAPLNNFYSSPFGAPPTIYDSPRLIKEYSMDLDAGLWDLRDGKHVWGSRTRVENANTSDFASRLSKKVVPVVSKQGLLAPR